MINHTMAAKAANLIKAELRNAFPTTKFSVKSQNFSMGNSVDIKWTDGPTQKEVEKITSKYQEGRFNGQEDIYEYSNVIKDMPQAKFVMTNRVLSDEKDAELRKVISDKFGISSEKAKDYDFENHTDYGRFFYELFCNTSFEARV